jgi:hypothetical protein
MGSFQPDFAVPDVGIGVFQLDLGISQALDFGSTQDDSTLEGIDDLEVVSRLAVGGYDLAPCHQM